MSNPIAVFRAFALFAGLLIALWTTPSPLAAQHGPENATGRVRIWSGERGSLEGELVSHSVEGVTISKDGVFFRVPLEDVEAVQWEVPEGNRALEGVVGGAVGGALSAGLIGMMGASLYDESLEGDEGVILKISAAGAGIGALLGLGIGALIHDHAWTPREDLHALPQVGVTSGGRPTLGFQLRF